MMDVLTLSPIFILIKDAVISLSAMTAAIVAIFGLRAWRNELKGKSEYKLAKDLLKSVYNVRDGFLHLRNPAIYSYEYPEIVEDDGSVKIDQSDKDYVYEKRWKILDEAFSELESFHLDAQVEWGALYNEKITAMRKCRSKLLLEIQNYLRNQAFENLTTCSQLVHRKRT